MSILKTKKGWAIEMQPVTYKETMTDKERSEHYTDVLNSLLHCIVLADENKLDDKVGYYAFELLEAMLPDYKNAESMFKKMETEPMITNGGKV